MGRPAANLLALRPCIHSWRGCPQAPVTASPSGASWGSSPWARAGWRWVAAGWVGQWAAGCWWCILVGKSWACCSKGGQAGAAGFPGRFQDGQPVLPWPGGVHPTCPLRSVARSVARRHSALQPNQPWPSTLARPCLLPHPSAAVLCCCPHCRWRSSALPRPRTWVGCCSWPAPRRTPGPWRTWRRWRVRCACCAVRALLMLCTLCLLCALCLLCRMRCSPLAAFLAGPAPPPASSRGPAPAALPALSALPRKM